jgi:hypothetical protein
MRGPRAKISNRKNVECILQSLQYAMHERKEKEVIYSISFLSKFSRWPNCHRRDWVGAEAEAEAEGGIHI